MNVPSRRERIAAQLADLKMPGALEALDNVLSGWDGGGTTASEAIERLLAGPDRHAQQSVGGASDAFQPNADDQDTLGVRLQFSAIDLTGADRLAA